MTKPSTARITGTIVVCPRCGTECRRRMVSADRYERVLDYIRDVGNETVLLPVSTLAMLAPIYEVKRLEALADSCRWANQGYREPGSIEDIERRLAIYERCSVLYIRSEQHLKQRIAELEKVLHENGLTDQIPDQIS